MSETQRPNSQALYSVPAIRMPGLILIGNGSIARVGQEVKRLGVARVLVVTDRHIVELGLFEGARETLDAQGIALDLFEDVESEPTIGLVQEAIDRVKGGAYDLVVGFGGGSVLDAAKLVACLAGNEGRVQDFLGTNRIPKHGLPCVLVPTTGGTGSEVSHVAMVTDETDGNKKLISDDNLLAAIAMVDPALTRSVPPRLTAYVGIDALTHAMGAYITRKANPVTDALAIEAIEHISRCLSRAVHQGQTDIEARYGMSLGAMLGMIARINSGGGAVHGLSYPLSTQYHLSHAQAVSVLLPWVMAFNVPSAVPKFARIARAMGQTIDGLSEAEAADRAVVAIKALMKEAGILQGLREFGIKQEDFAQFAEMVYEFSYRHIEANPRMLSKEEVAGIYRDAW